MKLFLNSLFVLPLFWGALLFWPAVPGAATLEVCPTCALSSIHEAIFQAQAGDTLEIKGGRYPEGMIFIDKPLHLRGVGHPIIDGLNKEHVFYIRADDVILEGLTIQNSGRSTISEYAGVRIEESRRCQFKNNILQGNTYSFYLAKVDTCLIENNEVTGNAQNEVLGGNGIHLWYSQHITLKNNILKKHRDGLYLEFTGDSQITGNISAQNIRYGMHFMFSSRNEFYHNTFTQNQTGVAVMYSHHVQMRQNRFEKSWGRSSYGILLKEINDSLIEENDLDENTLALFADGINRNRFYRNTFQDNGWAINILGSSAHNTFLQNNFLSNFFDVATNSTTESLNQFFENYWSDYQGYDLDHDGWGDKPFRPMKIFSLWVDKYPELVVMLGSPVIEFLEVAEKIFPVLTPKALQDPKPSMKAFPKKEKSPISP